MTILLKYFDMEKAFLGWNNYCSVDGHSFKSFCDALSRI